MKNSNYKANAAAITSIILWCFSGICFRKGAEFLNPMPYLSMKTGVGVLTVLAIQSIQKKKISKLFILPRKVIISGLFGITVYTVFLSTAFGLAKPEEVGLINLINYLWPVWIVILEIILLKRKSRKIIFFTGISLGFAGLIISSNFTSINFSTTSFTPHILALTGGFLWALYSVLLKKWKISDEQSGTALNFIICSVIAAAIGAFNGDWSTAQSWNGEALFWILFGGIGPVGVAYYLWEIGIKNGSIGFIASLSYFIPVGSSLLIGLIFVESMS